MGKGLRSNVGYDELVTKDGKITGEHNSTRVA
jgi:hypothetical protein